MNCFRTIRYALGITLATVALSPAVHASTINVNFQRHGDNDYSGPGVAPDNGTTWNNWPASRSTPSQTLTAAKDSAGNSTPVTITLSTNSGENIDAYATTADTTPDPTTLMEGYLDHNTYTVTLSNLLPGQYTLYGFGHGNKVSQNATFTLDSANGGGSASTTTTNSNARDLFDANAKGNSYVVLTGNVAAPNSSFTFQATDYLNGFQLTAVPEPASITLLLLGLPLAIGRGRPRRS